MDVMYWLIPVAIVLLTLAISAFIWAVKSDQYSDLESPAMKILLDDDSPATASKNTKRSSDPDNRPQDNLAPDDDSSSPANQSTKDN
ncbi:MAG: cbb3-type cytochrome oxidase assembly protein CcoS [Kangiellaceae bacterium]|jgi:cbb3-type cytochrome oxidase maturation protein|nr:cbb3-type cytochrome oxidase assembly protein CcoS [Kangiellaceae bacterium]